MLIDSMAQQSDRPDGNLVTSVVEGAVGLTGLSDWGRIASRIASWCIISLSIAYLMAGLFFSFRYSKHARSRQHEKESRSSHKQQSPSSSHSASNTARAAGARFLIVWVTVLIPVVYTLLGAILGFVLGMSIGSLIAGSCILADVSLSPELEIAIGIFISIAKVMLAFAPTSVSLTFL